MDVQPIESIRGANGDSCRRRGAVVGRVQRWSASPFMIDDLEPIQTTRTAVARLGRQRTSLGVPLLRDGEVDRAYRAGAPAGRAIYRPADRTCQRLRRSGGDRDGEHAARMHRAARRRWSSRPRPPKCCRSSAARPVDLPPVFDAMLETALGCARRIRQTDTSDGELLPIRGASWAFRRSSRHDQRSTSPLRPDAQLSRREPAQQVTVHIATRRPPIPRLSRRVRSLIGWRATSLRAALRKER